eukprot:1551664-Prymnesium_polylepis.3
MSLEQPRLVLRHAAVLAQRWRTMDASFSRGVRQGWSNATAWRSCEMSVGAQPRRSGSEASASSSRTQKRRRQRRGALTLLAVLNTLARARGGDGARPPRDDHIPATTLPACYRRRRTRSTAPRLPPAATGQRADFLARTSASRAVCLFKLWEHALGDVACESDRGGTSNGRWPMLSPEA